MKTAEWIAAEKLRAPLGFAFKGRKPATPPPPPLPPYVVRLAKRIRR